MPVETQKLFSLWDSIKLENFDEVGEIGVNSSGQYKCENRFFWTNVINDMFYRSNSKIRKEIKMVWSRTDKFWTWKWRPTSSCRQCRSNRQGCHRSLKMDFTNPVWYSRSGIQSTDIPWLSYYKSWQYIISATKLYWFYWGWFLFTAISLLLWNQFCWALF